MKNRFTPDRIQELEKEMQQLGRSVECVDPRIRPGHGADWLVRFKDGSVVTTCCYEQGQEAYVSMVAFALCLKEPKEE